MLNRSGSRPLSPAVSSLFFLPLLFLYAVIDLNESAHSTMQRRAVVRLVTLLLGEACPSRNGILSRENSARIYIYRYRQVPFGKQIA